MWEVENFWIAFPREKAYIEQDTQYMYIVFYGLIVKIFKLVALRLKREKSFLSFLSLPLLSSYALFPSLPLCVSNALLPL